MPPGESLRQMEICVEKQAGDLKGDVMRLKEWSLGLRIVLFWTLGTILVAAAQWVYWAFVTGELIRSFSPHFTAHGVYLSVALVLSVSIIAAALFERQKAFVCLCLIFNVVQMFVCLNAVVAYALHRQFVLWETLIVIAAGAVALYLCRYEIVAPSRTPAKPESPQHKDGQIQSGSALSGGSSSQTLPPPLSH